jgi:hypothetical protein
MLLAEDINSLIQRLYPSTSNFPYLPNRRYHSASNQGNCELSTAKLSVNKYHVRPSCQQASPWPPCRPQCLDLCYGIPTVQTQDPSALKIQRHL